MYTRGKSIESNRKPCIFGKIKAIDLQQYRHSGAVEKWYKVAKSLGLDKEIGRAVTHVP